MTGQDVLAPATETETLRQQLLQAQRLSSVGELASSIAHEFNNILTTIINSAKLGMRNADPVDKQQAFERVVKAGQRAATIAGGMLGFARKSSSHRQKCDVIRLVEEVLVLTEKDLGKHRVQVETRFDSRPTVWAVPGQIEQILVNLVINARQAMTNGGRLKIEVRENAEADVIEVRVSDTGVGIPPDHLRQIFEPFFTTKQPDEYGRGGTGLGLSVCRQIIEQHHGRIRVESVVGKGSTFTVKLPRRLSEDPE
ncbi:MAG: two-component sensor histidine kinase [Gemmataceae bacterium]|nr:two-component sensor histidine kinase [Gemmataceae bacterium]